MGASSKTAENGNPTSLETSIKIYSPNVTRIFPEQCLLYKSGVLDMMESPGPIPQTYTLFYDTGGSINNVVRTYVSLSPGSYKVIWRQRSYSDVANVDFYLDDQQFATFLMNPATYGSNISYNVCINENLSIGTDGLKKLEIKLRTGLGSSCLWRSLTFMRYI